jgi:hypothetical protein
VRHFSLSDGYVHSVVQRFAWDDDARLAALVCMAGEVRAAGVPLMEHPSTLDRKQAKQGFHHEDTKVESLHFRAGPALPACAPVHIPRETHQRRLRVLRVFVVKSLLAGLSFAPPDGRSSDRPAKD